MGMWCRGLSDSCDAFIPHTVGTDICATTWFRQHGAILRARVAVLCPPKYIGHSDHRNVAFAICFFESCRLRSRTDEAWDAVFCVALKRCRNHLCYGRQTGMVTEGW